MSDHTLSEFDRLVGALEGLPDVVKSKPSTVRAVLPLIGIAQTYIVQTYWQKDKGNTIFLEMIGNHGSIRLAIPPKVADAIAAQREAVSAKWRKKVSKRAAQERMASGIKPFVKKTGTEDK